MFNTILFLDVSTIIVPEIKTVWNALNPKLNFGEWVPENWGYLEEKLRTLLASPTIIDILRFRQLDFESIILNDSLI